MNCRVHPATNSASGTGQSPSTKIATAKRGTDAAIMGMPRVWHSRLTGCWWLCAYRAIHSLIGRLPSIMLPPRDAQTSQESPAAASARRSVLSGELRPELLERRPGTGAHADGDLPLLLHRPGMAGHRHRLHRVEVLPEGVRRHAHGENDVPRPVARTEEPVAARRAHHL